MGRKMGWECFRSLGGYDIQEFTSTRQVRGKRKRVERTDKELEGY